MKPFHLLILIVLFALAKLDTSAQNTVSLPDPSSKIQAVSHRQSNQPTEIPSPVSYQPAPASPMDWWRDARFGMFIHWGLYSVPAGEWNGKSEYGEWIRTSAEIPLDTYDQFRLKFNPVKFDADAWVKMARDAGMKYIVITSKHHDGFCMFDTKQTDFNIMTTPFKRDPMKELASACRKYGLKFCFYHSIMDWHHPDYLPRRDWEKNRPVAGAEYNRYVAYMKAQLKELLTNYGDIGVLWFDGEWESTWNEGYGKDIYAYVKNLQPAILVNNRVGAGRLDMEGLTKEGAFGGDFGTPEQQIPATGLPGVDWETCMTMNDHWGYNKADSNFKTSRELIRMLADIASKGGNYLLNVGPTAEGLIPDRSVERLADIGRWMKVNGEAICGTSASPFKKLEWGRCTQKMQGNGATTLYLHVFDWPSDGKLHLPGVLNAPIATYLLADPVKRALPWNRTEDALTIDLPPTPPDPFDCVVAVVVKGKPDITDPPEFVTDVDSFTDMLAVVLSSDRDNIEIRYSEGINDPLITSSLYNGPIHLNTTTTLSIRCFRDGRPVSGTATRTFRKVEPLKQVAAANLTRGIGYRYYEGEWDSLPAFNALKPVKEGVLSDFSFKPRNQDERFAFDYNGFIAIPETGVYTFFVGSDDGSRLWIDGTLVVNNDGLHGLQEKQGNVPLEKGYHRLRVGFFERTGSDNIAVYVKSQTLPKRLLPAEWLYTNK